MTKLDNAIRKIAGSFKEDYEQIKDPRQLSFKFINENEIKIGVFSPHTISTILLELLSRYFHNNGTLVETYRLIKNIKSFKQIADVMIFVAFYKNKPIGVLTVEEGEYNDVSIFIKSEYRQQGIGSKLLSEAKKHYSKLDVGSSPIGDIFYQQTGDIPKNERKVYKQPKEEIEDRSQYNTPTLFNDIYVSDIRLTFEFQKDPFNLEKVKRFIALLKKRTLKHLDNFTQRVLSKALIDDNPYICEFIEAQLFKFDKDAINFAIKAIEDGATLLPKNLYKHSNLDDISDELDQLVVGVIEGFDE